MATQSIDEGVFYISKGNPSDKSQSNSIALSSSLHNSSNFQSFRQCSSNKNGFTFVGGFKDKLIVACPNKALIHVYSHGKESPDQRIPIPEELTCVASCNHPGSNKPWLLAGGSKTGKLYIWELSSGLLLQVKEIHYQAVTSLSFTSKGEFIISGSTDSRVIIWKTFDLISFPDESKALKPYAAFTDHTLPIHDIVITNGQINDVKIYTCSEDCTVRCYDIHTKSLLTTFIAPNPVHSLAIDPAERTIFFGLSTGVIRLVPLYTIDPQTRVLEKVGGNSRIVTLPNDLNLTSSFVHHQGAAVTTLQISIDGTYLCSGDDTGRVFASDVVTRQNFKKFKELPFAISGIYCFVQHSNETESTYVLPVLKRVLTTSQDLIKHEVYKNSELEDSKEDFDLRRFLNETKDEELTFLNLSNVQSTVTNIALSTPNEGKQKIADLEAQVLALTKGYTDLRQIHEELFTEHTKLISERD